MRFAIIIIAFMLICAAVGYCTKRAELSGARGAVLLRDDLVRNSED